MQPPTQSFFIQPSKNSWYLYEMGDSWNFQRIKNSDQVTNYKLSATIGLGFNAVIFDLDPQNEKKFKAIKIYNQSVTPREYELIQKLNSHGPQIGILKPGKAFFPAVSEFNIPAMLVMPKYQSCLLELLDKEKIADDDAINALRQITAGLLYLKENFIYHGDISLRNILFKEDENGKRYDIADFESGLDFKNFTTLEEFRKAMSERPPFIGYFETLSLDHLSNEEATERYRQLLFRHDAASFGYLISELVSLVPHLSIAPDLTLLAEEIKRNQSIDFVFERLSVHS